SSMGTWLHRLGVNLCLDRLRSKARRNDLRTDMLEAEVAAPSDAPQGIGMVGRLDLERAIRELPDGCRAAFLLHDVEGFEHKEVAAMLGIAEGTSKSQVHKARRRLRSALSPVPAGGFRP